MKKKKFGPFLISFLTLFSTLIGKEIRSQLPGNTATITLPLSHDNFSIFDFAEVRMETGKSEIPPVDIVHRKFQPVKEIFKKDEFQFPDSVKSFWIKIQFANNQSSDTSIALRFSGGVAKAVLFKAEGDKLREVGKTGFFIARLKRSSFYPDNRIDLALKAHTKETFFIQAVLFHGIWLPKMPVLQSIANAEMLDYRAEKEVFNGNLLWNHFFTGIFFMFFVFGFIKYLVLGKDKAYLYYALLGLFSALMAVSHAEYPPLELPWFENLRGIELFDLMASLANVMQALFILEILQLKNKYPRITLTAKWLIGSGLFFATIHIIQFAETKEPAPVLWTLKLIYSYLYGLFLLGWVIYLVRVRKGFYRFLLLGAITIFVAYVLSLVIGYLNLFYLFPRWFTTDPRGALNHFMQIAFVIDMLFYFTGLAQRDRQVEKDKIAFQSQLIQQLETNKNLQEKFTGELEQQVKEKTAEVIKEKAEVESTLQELRSAQAQLIQSEKMASLGELTAGIAHEIQNPLNFVNNFSEINSELIEELKNEKLKEDGQRDILLEDQLLGSIEKNEQKINHHGKRADAIVKGMLQHSRTTAGHKEETDINALADEYLRLSYHGIRARDKNFSATLETHFDESIGKINIVPQDIGRVLLNLYNNAFYALAEKNNQPPAGYKPTVSISTKKIKGLSGYRVEVSVMDNGMGIPQKVIDKIFQPFFTTKPTGQGTGLGLSLAYDIVKTHGGDIKVESKEGDGTIIRLELPI